MNLIPLLFILLLIFFIYNNSESKDLNLNIDNCKCN